MKLRCQFFWHHIEEEIQRLSVIDVVYPSCTTCQLYSWEDPKDTSFAKALKGGPPFFKSSLVTLLCSSGMAVGETTTDMGSPISSGYDGIKTRWTHQLWRAVRTTRQSDLACRGPCQWVIDHSVLRNEIDGRSIPVLLDLYPSWSPV